MYNPIGLTLIIYKNSFTWNNFLAISKVFLYFCKIMNVSIIVIGAGNMIVSNNIPYKLLIKKMEQRKEQIAIPMAAYIFILILQHVIL